MRASHCLTHPAAVCFNTLREHKPPYVVPVDIGTIGPIINPVWCEMRMAQKYNSLAISCVILFDGPGHTA